MREVVNIRLGGADHPLCPTFGAYGDIEARLGPIRTLYTSVMTGVATLHQMSVIVAIGMRAAGQDRVVDENKVAKMIYDQGVWSDEVLASLSDFLASLGWTPEQRRQIEAEVEKQANASSA